MKKIKFKWFLNIIVLMFIIFLISFISNLKVSAQNQTGDQIVMDTTGYSILSSYSFVLAGAYSGDYDQAPFTTYFEYKKGDSNLDDATDREETIKIVSPTKLKPTVDESGVFYSNPELTLFSTYYFRAVGYFNDNPDIKFYGQVLALTTGYYPNGNLIPNGNITPISVTYGQTPGTISSDGTVYGQTPGTNILQGYQMVAYNIPNVCDFLGSLLSTCGAPSSITSSIPTYVPVIPNISNQTPTPPNPQAGNPWNTNTGLVPCTDNCAFKDILTLINTIMHYLLYVIALPLSAIMFAYAGFELLTSGGSTEKKSKAKKIFINVAIGLVIVAAAFLIVKAILMIVGYNTSVGINWFGF